MLEIQIATETKAFRADPDAEIQRLVDQIGRRILTGVSIGAIREKDKLLARFRITTDDRALSREG